MSTLRKHAGRFSYGENQTADLLVKQILSGELNLQDLPDLVVEDLISVLSARAHDRRNGGPDVRDCAYLIAAAVFAHLDAARRITEGRTAVNGPVNLHQAAHLAAHLIDRDQHLIHEALAALVERQPDEAA